MYKKIKFLVKKFIERNASKINHEEVINTIVKESEISVGYFGFLIVANLIALLGLIQNSAPVIIGAMLISPLMGPILSFGYAFISGEKNIWWKSIKKLILSIFLTIVIAAIVTIFLPLKNITSEIISRTSPNFYDLLIAFLAGMAGAVALCTKKNYIIIASGVAISTAVIPPLSVTGFGIGIGSFKIASGSFGLFFTNAVAIIISTCIMFLLYGFKPRTITGADISALKRRITYLSIVLFIISIPLMYTLYKSVTDIKLRMNIEKILKQEFDKPGISRLSYFNLQKKTNSIDLYATVNTTKYIQQDNIKTLEEKISKEIGYEVHFYIEQVKVQPGGLKEISIKEPRILQKTSPEIIQESKLAIFSVVKKSINKIEEIISPSRVDNFSIGFQEKIPYIFLTLKIKRDTPISEEQVQWLRKMLETDLSTPVELSIEISPFVQPLVFDKGETSITDEMKSSLLTLREIYKENNQILIILESIPESVYPYKKRIKLATERLKNITAILTKEYGIPDKNIKTIISKQASHRAQIKIKVSVE